MIDYKYIFSGKSIYDYPFSNHINNFTILGWTNINTLEESDYSTLISILKSRTNKILVNFISREGVIYEKVSYNLIDFTYSKYREICLGKGDYNIFFEDLKIGLSFSEEFFCLIGGPKDFISEFIQHSGKNRMKNNLDKFTEEWSSNNKSTWAHKLLKRDNIIKY